MIKPPTPENEDDRIKALHSLELDYSQNDPDLDAITELASSICEVPVSLITLIDTHTQYIKSRYGSALKETERESAFCAHAINEPSELMEVTDATKDERFSENPFVTGPDSIVFYAGYPLLTTDGYALGALCVIDSKPRKLTALQAKALQTLSRHAVRLLELQKSFRDVKTREQQLATSEMRYRALVENGGDAVVILDETMNPTYVSPSIKKVLGYSEEEAMNLNMFDVLHPDDVEAVSKSIQEAHSKPGEVIKGHTSRMKDKTGNWKWIEANVTNLLHNPEIKGFVDNFRDVTDRVSAEIEREEALNALKERVKEQTYLYKISALNELELKSGEILKKAAEWLPEAMRFPKNACAKITYRSASFKSRGFQSTAISITSKENVPIQIQVSYHGLKNMTLKDAFLAEEFALIENTARTLHLKLRQKEVIADLNDREEKLSRAQRIARLGYWRLESTEENITWSEEVFRIWGIEKTDDKISYDFFISTIHPDDLDYFLEHQEASQKGIRNLDVEHRILLSDGSIKWVHERGEIIKNKSGSVVYIDGSVQDITERKSIENELSNKSLLLASINSIISKLQKSTNWLDIIDQCLAQAGESVNADRVYIFENHVVEDKLFTTQTHEWTSSKEFSLINHPDRKDVALDAFTDIFSSLSRNKPFIANTRSLSKSVTKDTFEAQAIKSVILFPIFTDHRFDGFMGFDQCRSERLWSNDEKEFLQTFASNLSASIHKESYSKALMEAHDENITIIERITLGFVKLDTDWKVTYWNKQAEELSGIKRDNILNRSIWEAYPIDSHAEIHEKLISCQSNNQRIHFETYCQVRALWLELSVFSTKKGCTIYVRNITERKEAIAQIERSNERFHYASQATNDAIWDWELTTGNHFWGEGFRKLFGHDLNVEKIEQQFWIDQVHPEDADRVVKSMHDAIDDPKANFWREEYRYIKISDGSIAHILDSGFIIRDTQQKAIRMVGAMRDISENKVYEQSLKSLNSELERHALALLRSNNDLEQFAYVASHDLQEPLRMITSFMTQLDRNYGNQLDDRAKKYIHFATDGARRMRQIILDLLEFSKVRSSESEMTAIDTGQLIEEIKLTFRKQIQATGAVIDYEAMPVILVNKLPLIQVFQNLIGNALKYHAKNRTPAISIYTKESPTHWTFFVKDNGIGISEEYYEKVFYIFQRLHSKNEYSGSGIGLAIAKKIVEREGGEINVQSEEGKGSTFYFTVLKHEPK